MKLACPYCGENSLIATEIESAVIDENSFTMYNVLGQDCACDQSRLIQSASTKMVDDEIMEVVYNYSAIYYSRNPLYDSFNEFYDAVL